MKRCIITCVVAAVAAVALAAGFGANIAGEIIVPRSTISATTTNTVNISSRSVGWEGILAASSATGKVEVSFLTDDLTGTNFVALAPNIVPSATTVAGTNSVIVRVPAGYVGKKLRVVTKPYGSATVEYVRLYEPR